MKEHSVAHYLLEIQNSILYNQDLGKPQAAMMAGVDITKGFNKVEHNECITQISDMGCPNWLLKILISYLSKRQLICFLGKQSRRAPLKVPSHDFSSSFTISLHLVSMFMYTQ